MMDENIVMPND